MYRIAYCITDLDVGGAEKCLYELVTRLDRTRFQAHVLCLSGPGTVGRWLTDQGVSVTCLGARSWRDLAVVGRLARALRRGRFHLLHTFLFHANIAGRLASRWIGLRPVVSSVRVAERRSRLHLVLDFWTHPWCDMEVCVSDDVLRFTHRQARIPRAKLMVIPNGVDVDRFAAASPVPWPSLGVPEGVPVVLVVGRLERQKAPELAIEALARLVHQGRDQGAHLVLAGSGPELQALRHQAAALGLAKRVHLVGWQPDVASLMKASALVLLPSRWEGMPNVALEALACATPLVATRVEGLRQILPPDMQTGLVPPGDSQSLAEAVAAVLAAPSRFRALAVQGQRHVREHFSLLSMTEAYQCLYHQLLVARR